MDLRFGHYRLRRAERLLLGPEGPVELSARSFDILAMLLGKPDGVVGKTELFEAVWPDLVVEDNTLQVHVSALRKALAPGMIVTVHGRGYKYAGPPPLEVEAEQSIGARIHGDLAGPGASSDYKPVIAVLPFTNMSGDVAQDYFSDGITEDIIVDLSRYSLLKVVSRHSSSCFKGAGVDVREAGRALGAKYLVEGSVRRMGASVRVTAQLLDAATASHVWAERYDRELSNAFSVQDELVRRLVSTVAGHVERHSDSRARSKPTESLDAYDCWLRANHGFDLWTLDGNKACKRLLEEAIRKDPMFARAHASMAFCHIRSATMTPGSVEVPELEAEALRSAEHAVRLDPSDTRAHNAVGWSLMSFREFERAGSAFATSASLNPNDGSACIDRALALAILGDQPAADEAAEIATTLNPMGGAWFYSVLAMVHFAARRYQSAEKYFALGPRTWPEPLAWHAANLTYLGQRQQASEVMSDAMRELGAQWCGPAPMKPDDFLDWLHHTSMLRRREDWEHLFHALPMPEARQGSRFETR